MRYIVTAVESRKDCIEYLQKRIPNLEVVWEDGRGAHETFKRSLNQIGLSPAVHLEDDIWITKDFCKKIELIISQKPKDLIQFFSMRKADLTAGSRWDNDYLMNQCWYSPFGFSKALLDFEKTHPLDSYGKGAMDVLVKQFLKSAKRKYWIHVPSLVDHRVGKSNFKGRASTNRQSFTFKDGDYGDNN